MRNEGDLEEIRVTAPRPGACAVCESLHDAQDPHDRDSLYYQNQFYKQHKRFPTWSDAMAHCSEITKAVFRQRLERRGISIDPEEGAQHGR